MAAQDWLLVGILISVSSGLFYVGQSQNGAGAEPYGLLVIAGVAIGLGGYVMAQLNASASRE
ncbi:hypothetical protein [Halomarina rubra]|uniref:Uncharacterized protein n=1 Tax=Halomarina rubra TaxID=2071873 RepID=A0ABD6B0L7_9EURY|nr:hypothetical protein [Halomarina rubra]